MSIASKLEKLATDITSAYGAINTKGGTIPSSKNTENLANAITSIPQGGGGGLEEKDVNFYDYDGTLTNSYTKAEFLALSALPENPTHAGLTSQGWNWTLSDAKTHVTTYTKLDIGQMYITDDGKTRIYITLTNDDLAGLNLGICVNGSVTVDWGDTTSETVTGSSLTTIINTPHTYSQAGDYIIKITCNTGNNFSFKGVASNSSTSSKVDISGSRVLFKTNNISNSITVSQTLYFSINKIELGSGITTLQTAAFRENYGLKTITLPNTLIDISSSYASGTFYYCYNLKALILPNQLTSTSQYLVGNCYSLVKIVFPDNITIGSSACYLCTALKSLVIPKGSTNLSQVCNRCYSLESIVIPNTVTTLSSTFQQCQALKEVHAKNVTTLSYYTFQLCYSLETVELSNNLSSVSSGEFTSCNSLFSISNLNNITSLGQNMFGQCYNLQNYIPSTITTIPSSAYSSNYAVSVFNIPSTVTSIEAQAFQNCFKANFDFSNHTSIPTLANSNAFSGCKGKIIVPDSLYTTWIAASNWSALSSQIVKASEA